MPVASPQRRLFDAKAGRYVLHDLVRLFAATKLDSPAGDPGERARGSLRFASHYVDALRRSNMLYLSGGDRIRDGLLLFDTELSNIGAAQAWAGTNRAAAIQIAETCSSSTVIFAASFRLLALTSM